MSMSDIKRIREHTDFLFVASAVTVAAVILVVVCGCATVSTMKEEAATLSSYRNKEIGKINESLKALQNQIDALRRSVKPSPEDAIEAQRQFKEAVDAAFLKLPTSMSRQERVEEFTRYLTNKEQK